MIIIRITFTDSDFKIKLPRTASPTVNNSVVDLCKLLLDRYPRLGSDKNCFSASTRDWVLTTTIIRIVHWTES